MVLINLIFGGDLCCSNMMPINIGIKFRKYHIVNENHSKISKNQKFLEHKIKCKKF